MGLLMSALGLVLLGLFAKRAQARSPFWRGRLKFGQGGIWPADDEFDSDKNLRLWQARRGGEFLLGRFALFLGTVLLIIALLNLA